MIKIQRKWQGVVAVLALLIAAVAQTAAAAPANPATWYLHVRRSLSRSPLSAALFQAAQQNPSQYIGAVFEVSASVGGTVSADGRQTALLSLGNQTLSAHLPALLNDASWIVAGHVVRALLRVERTGNAISLTNLSMVAAAPEYDVAQAERSSLTRTAALPSRSFSNRGGRGAVDYAAGYGLSYGGPTSALSARAARLYVPYRAAIHRLNHRLSDGELNEITTWVLKASDAYNIDPRLVIAMIIAESDFDIYSTSRTGAMGLGQLMPSTAQGLGVTNAYDPIQNIAAAVHILHGHLDKYGGVKIDSNGNPTVIPFQQIALVMAAYNAGPGAVHKYHGVPPYRETQRYVARVAALYRQLLTPEERKLMQP